MLVKLKDTMTKGEQKKKARKTFIETEPNKIK
jgi:hypothetical protein